MGAAKPQKALARFLAPGAVPGQRVLLDPKESHHLQHVRRLKEGAEILLLDLKGHEFKGRVQKLGRRVWVEVTELVREETPKSPELILGLPLLKKDHLSFLVEKAVELGLSRVILYFSKRTVVKPGPNLIPKLEFRAAQSLKQCARLWPLVIEGPKPLFQVAEEEASYKLVAYEKEKNLSLKEALNRIPSNPGKLFFLSGPEGGFSPEEVSFLQEKGFLLAHLGDKILRAETAAFYLISVAHLWFFL